MTPEEYCQQKAAPAGSSLYYALYFADPAKRPALAALYAYQREVTEVVQAVREPAVARAKLQWWREELQRTFDGQPQHPITQALQQDVIGRYKLAREYFEQVIEGTEMDLEYGVYPSFKELSLYCHRAGGSITQLAVDVCGYQDRQTVRYAHDLGMGLCLTSLLRNVRRDVDAGRIYLPEDEMRQTGVSRDDLYQRQTPERVRELFALQAERIRAFFAQALERLPAQDRPVQRPGLILAQLDLTLLDEMEREGFPLLERSFRLTPIRKLWIAWRTARRHRI
jgi:phytoene synthase